MTSLTTLFVVGPEEYVEFNESMGSKAFLEHIWDQSRSPLKREETSASGTQLHSAGARISQTPPPKIEFPTVLRLRGRGNRYQATGRFISWEELKRKNPMALKDPPSLDDFVQQGSQVGVAERLEPGAFLKGEKRFKIDKRPKGAVEVHEDDDGWIGGSSESVYAKKGSSDSIYAAPPKHAALLLQPAEAGSSSSDESERHVNGKFESHDGPVRTLRKSRSGLSLSARLGMDEKKTGETNQTSKLTNEKAQKTTSKAAKPTFLSLPDNSIPSLAAARSGESTFDTTYDKAEAPLSATHSPPETPMKYPDNKRSINISATPVTEKRLSDQQNEMTESTATSALLLDAGQERFVRSCQSNEKTASTPAKAARSQIDEMLAKLRQARSGFSGGGSGESMWAPKSAAEDSPESKEISSQGTPSTKPVDRTATDRKIVDEPQETVRLPSKEPKKAAHAPSDRKQPALSTQKSLLDRLGPKVDANSGLEQGSKPTRKASLAKSLSVNPAAESISKPGEIISSNVALDKGAAKAEIAPNTPEEVSIEPEEVAHSRPQDVTEDQLGPSLQSTDVKHSEGKIPTTESKTSDLDNLSTVGNDTLTSFNWADDDDDESLPDLPDDWAKPLLSASPNASANRRFSMTSSSVASIGNNSEAGDVAQMPLRNGKERGAKRGKKPRTDKRGKKDNVDAKPDAPKQPPTEPRGMKIAGRAAGKTMTSTADTESALPYWERRKGPSAGPGRQSSSPPSAPLGMRIAGSAQSNTAPRSSGQHGSAQAGRGKSPRELFPNADAKPSAKHRGGSGMTLPPNLKPLESTFAPPSTTNEAKTASRPRLSTKADGAFARLSKGAIGVNRSGEQQQNPKKADDQRKGKNDSNGNRSAKAGGRRASQTINHAQTTA